jgi:hypothetical protein
MGINKEGRKQCDCLNLKLLIMYGHYKDGALKLTIENKLQNLSVPAQNSYIKAKNIKLKLIEVSNDC